jgi:hypothetical protein
MADNSVIWGDISPGSLFLHKSGFPSFANVLGLERFATLPLPLHPQTPWNDTG